jgi:hypothetical protein
MNYLLSVCMNVEMRYEYVKLNFSQMSLTPTEKARWMTTNTMTLYLSHLAAFGLFMLASFQVSCNKMTIASYGVMVMVFNATFNNISAMSWQSALLVEKTGVSRENHRPVIQTLSHNVVSSTPRHERDSNSTT